MKTPKTKYKPRKSLARLRQVVIEYCQEAREWEDFDTPITLEYRIKDFAKYIKLAGIV